jgi:hypothetical protein
MEYIILQLFFKYLEATINDIGWLVSYHTIEATKSHNSILAYFFQWILC